MRLLAKQTGGLAFYNANDLSGSIQRAIDAARLTYTLGFYPPETAGDGKDQRAESPSEAPSASPRGLFRKRARRRIRGRSQASAATCVASPLEGAAIGVRVNVESIRWTCGVRTS
jgi:hypothetical protein